MPSTFDQDFGDAVIDDLFAEFGEPVIYFPKGGFERTIEGIVGRPKGQQKFRKQTEEQQFHKLQTEMLELKVRKDAVLGMDIPQPGDAIRLSGEDECARWVFVSSIEDGNAFVVTFLKTKVKKHGHMPSQL